MNQNLYSLIHAIENLEASWQLVKANKGAPGVDHEGIQKIAGQWDTIRAQLQARLKEESYHPLPGRRVYIPKPNGKKRPLTIPSVKDRIAQQATRHIIEPILDPMFEDFSYGFRPGKSAKQALGRVDKILESGLKWVIQIDLAQFFDMIPHEIIMKALRNHISDEKVCSLVKKFLKAGVMEEGKMRHSTTGTPQGGVISPLLANLVLDAVDKYIKSHGDEGMVRYADDFVIMAKTRKRAVHVMKEVVILLNQLGLEVNQDKSRIVHVSERFVFLGYEFGGGGYGKGEGGTVVNPLWKRISPKAIQAFKDKIRILTRRLQPRNTSMLKDMLNPAIRGWAHYFREGYHISRFRSLDEWYRMRLRCFIHKRKSYLDNYKYPTSFFTEMGYIFLADFIMPAMPQQQALRV